ncbi:hypothetical protein AB0M39_07995 [Streptomyces sp. NPDC051907]|uniref:hypothetical protein n=1 Tax=Streptomyces sp. NPDC051907 TaxID=3155284 RepID=UPI0034272FA1
MDVRNSQGNRRDQQRTAIYLRCYPHDIWQMEIHRRMLVAFSLESGLGAPPVFLDNGCRSYDAKPCLESLLRKIAAGDIDTVLIPGPFVFSLDDKEAQEIVRHIEDAACRVLELPPFPDRAARSGSRDGHEGPTGVRAPLPSR